MAIMNVRGYKRLASDNAGGTAQTALEPAISGENVTIAGASAATAAMAATVTVVRVSVDTACYVEFGATPVAAAGTAYLPASAIEYFAIPPGGAYKVACIAA